MMQVSEQVIDRARQAFSAVIGRDGDAMVAALQGLSEDDSAALVGLALFVCGFVAKDVYRDGPTEDEYRALARQIVDTESSWVQLNVDTVARLLRAAAEADLSLGGVPREDIAGNAFVAGGHLLGAFSLDGQTWWRYLDEILTEMKTSPEAS
jgi:hypothetical protein